MHFTDRAIILAARRHGEHTAIVRVLTEAHGVYAGAVRGAAGKAGRGLWQPGNHVLVNWKARLPEHVGAFTGEMIEAVTAYAMQDAGTLSALSSACALVAGLLPERAPHPGLYASLAALTLALKAGADWPEHYARFELALLSECGFRLDLSSCAATGVTEDLVYVSPKSGRAVSRAAGEPYKDRMLPLPSFLLPPPAGGRVGEGVTRVHYKKPDRYGSHALIPNARELRSTMTEAEKKLWYHLRAHRFNGYRFRRQHPISPHYIADFVCLAQKLIIEVDGGQHNEQQAYDEKRTAVLTREGYCVLRFWNNEVLGNIESVLEQIAETLEHTPSLTLPPAGGGDIPVMEILASLRLTGYFLAGWALAPHDRAMPAARGRLLERLRHGIVGKIKDSA